MDEIENLLCNLDWAVVKHCPPGFGAKEFALRENFRQTNLGCSQLADVHVTPRLRRRSTLQNLLLNSIAEKRLICDSLQECLAL